MNVYTDCINSSVSVSAYLLLEIVVTVWVYENYKVTYFVHSDFVFQTYLMI